MFATINIYKPKGITSHDVVSRLRRVYGIKKIGHLGTLDPLAEGVLPLCIGQATRLIEYFPSGKRYTAEITLGRTTTTLDSEGEELSNTDCSALDLSLASLEAVLAQFRGTIMQQVPLYSAVHVGGKKLYELARQGKTADLPVREAVIHQLTCVSIDRQNPQHPVLTVDVQCGSGTYIRSLARDIGEALGCGAYMSGLVRTEHGLFSVKDSVDLEALQQSPEPQASLQDPLPYLGLTLLALKDELDAQKLWNGMKVSPPLDEAGVALKVKPNALYVVTWQDKPLGVVQAVSHLLKPVKIFYLDEGA
ncbi:tRNA pseudouridine(55) synthase TruB [Vampirovibrio sp.]|uniref:tRNA pseudouridine(55) synthase TruB n=1 Tax=Vampirovibrio sp. TaxID=2717857 RepID=UPI003594339D